ncbi:MAG TPA: glycosyltransferase [Verrucomicrobiae bacterium]|nr:glycosyltransferase [Verrucomicrobiae bacterium]
MMTGVPAAPKKICGKVSILMPAFNESKAIAANLREVVATFREFAAEFEVIVVDDGSPDDTYLHAGLVLHEHPECVRVVRYDRNQGKGNALIAGAEYVRGEYVVFLDADMDLHPSQLPAFFEIMEKTGADAVIGSKRHPQSRIVNYPPVRHLYSFGYYSIVRLLFGLPLRDTQTGLKLFRRKLLDDVFPRVLAKRFAFDIELLAIARHLGYTIAEAPVRLEFQRKSRISWPEVWRIFVDTAAIFYRLRILRYYDSAGAASARPDFVPSRELSVSDIDVKT